MEKDTVDSQIRQENEMNSEAAAVEPKSTKDSKKEESGGFDFSAAAWSGGVVLVGCAIVWYLIVKPKQEKARELKRKTIEMECMRTNFSNLQKSSGSFHWESVNPAFDEETKLESPSPAIINSDCEETKHGRCENPLSLAPLHLRSVGLICEYQCDHHHRSFR